MTSSSDSADLFRQLLDTRSWVALDIDVDGRVLAGHDDLGSQQLVEIAPDGVRTPLTDLPSRVRGRYVRGRRQIVVEHDQGGDENYQLSLLDVGRLPAAPVGLDGLEPLVRDEGHMNTLLDVTETSVVYSSNRRNDVDMDVVVRDLATGEERVVYDGGGYVAGSQVSHDEKSVAVTMISLQPSSTAIVVADGTGSREVTDPDEHAGHHVAGWTSDDAALVLMSDHDREFNAVLRVADDGGTWTTLVEEAGHDLGASLSPDGALMVVSHHLDGLDRLTVHRADGTHVADVDLDPVVPMSLVWAPDSSAFAVTAMTPTDPGSIVRVDARSGTSTVVVDGRDGVPAAVRDRLVVPDVHRIPTPDGEEIPCFRYVAPGNSSGASVVHVHGGPEAEANRIFSPVLQALALAGLDVLVPNVRGSSGYGKRWVSLDDVELRLDSVADLAAIHAWLPSVGLDPARSALWGGSYGGYMVLSGVSMQPRPLGRGRRHRGHVVAGDLPREHLGVPPRHPRTRVRLARAPPRVPGPRLADHLPRRHRRAVVRDPRRQRPARTPLGGRADQGGSGRQGRAVRAAGLPRRGPRTGQAREPPRRLPGGPGVPRDPSTRVAVVRSTCSYTRTSSGRPW